MSVAAVGGPPRRRSGQRYSGVPASSVDAGGGRLHQSAGAEVHEDDAAAFLAHHVVRLDVAVDQPLGVDGGERAAQRPADDDRLVGAVGAARVDLGGQRPAVHELHPQADTALVLVGAVDDDDVGMLDAGEYAAFVEDPRGQIVAAEALRQQLHGDVPARADRWPDRPARTRRGQPLSRDAADPRPRRSGCGRRGATTMASATASNESSCATAATLASTRKPWITARASSSAAARSSASQSIGSPRRRGRQARGGQPAGHRASRVISLTSRATARWVATREAAALGRPSRSASSL